MIRVRVALCLALVLLLPVYIHASVMVTEVFGSAGRQLDLQEDGRILYGAELPWTDINFDASSWASVNLTSGGLQRTLGSLPRNSLFLRCTFTATAAEANGTLRLAINWADGFIAYLNNAELFRANMGPAGMFTWYDMQAMNTRPNNLTSQTFPLPLSVGKIVAGSNVVALQVHRNDVNVLRVAFNVSLVTSTAKVVIGNGATCQLFDGYMQPSGQVFDPVSPSVAGVLQGSAVEPSDWIYNDGSTAVDLSGYSLTDNSYVPRQWVFPSGSTIESGAYIVLLCDEGNYRGSMLHTSFSLDSDGGYVSLYDTTMTLLHRFNYSKQSPFHSFGVDPVSKGLKYLFPQTPGKPNVNVVAFDYIVDKPDFGFSGGFYPSSVQVSMTSKTFGAKIYYTIDGKEPTKASTLYSSPILISANTVVRARAYLDGVVPSEDRTEQYLIGQSDIYKSAVILTLSGDGSKTMYRPEGVLAIVGGIYTPWRASSTTAYNDYSMPLQREDALKRPMSLKMIFNGINGEKDLTAVDIDVSFSGSNAHRPGALFFDGTPDAQMDTFSPWNQSSDRGNKIPSFLFVFRSQYGMGRLKKKFSDASELVMQKRFRIKGTRNEFDFLIDEFSRRMFYDMGHVQNLGAITPMFINGLMKGMFNTAEKLDSVFLSQANFLPESSKFDIYYLTYPGIDEGDDVFFNQSRDFLQKNNMSDPAMYSQFIDTYLDIDSYIDYILLETWVGNSDWISNNVHAYRLRDRTSRLSKINMIVWDVENGWKQNDINMLQRLFTKPFPATGGTVFQLAGGFFSLLYNSSEFRLRYADRYYKHFYNGGAMANATLTPKYDALYAVANPLKQLIYGVTLTRTKFDNFTKATPSRNTIYVDQLLELGLWQPKVVPPRYSVKSLVVPTAFNITITNPNANTSRVYYALGKDPRAIGGAVAGTTYTTPITITEPTKIFTRAFLSRNWSAVNEISVMVLDAFTLSVTEVMYNPLGGDDYSFVELKNIGTKALFLDSVQLRIDDALAYEFPPMYSIPAGAFLVLSFNPDGHAIKYSVNASAYSCSRHNQYIGYGLKKASTVSFVFKPTKTTIASFTYNSTDPWPTAPKSQGYSLVPVNPNPTLSSLANPVAWRSSANIGGSPGTDDPIPPTSSTSPTSHTSPTTSPSSTLVTPSVVAPSSADSPSPLSDMTPSPQNDTQITNMPPSDGTEIPWWVWLILAIAVLLLVIGIVLILFKTGVLHGRKTIVEWKMTSEENYTRM